MLTIVYSKSNDTWDMGTNRADVNAAGRATMDLIARDLEFSLADEILAVSFGKATDTDGKTFMTYGFTNDQISVVSLQNDNYNGQRAVREVRYYLREMTDTAGKGLDRFELMRGIFTDEITEDDIKNGKKTYEWHCYYAPSTNNPAWYDESSPIGRPTASAVVVENVAGLRVYVSNSDTNTYVVANKPAFSLPTGGWNSDQITYSNSLPTYVDVVLDLLDEDRSKQVAATTGTDQRDILERNVKRFVSRVYFLNRDGYKDRL